MLAVMNVGSEMKPAEYCMIHVMRKTAFYICENKGRDQFCGNRAADQRLYLHYIDINVVKTKALCLYLHMQKAGFLRCGSHH